MNTTSEGSSRFPERDHGEVLAELLNVPDKFILDIGCGSGRLTRVMEKMGASVVGIDPGAKQLERARSQSVTGSDFYVKATAENLPVNNNSVHIAVFFNSLHHIPISFMGNALSEAYRVLKNGGVLYVAEPLAEGPLFELSKPFNNETKVREKAYETRSGIRVLQRQERWGGPGCRGGRAVSVKAIF